MCTCLLQCLLRKLTQGRQRIAKGAVLLGMGCLMVFLRVAGNACVQAMGFTKAKSKEALEECGNDVQSALDWLVTNCI